MWVMRMLWQLLSRLFICSADLRFTPQCTVQYLTLAAHPPTFAGKKNMLTLTRALTRGINISTQLAAARLTLCILLHPWPWLAAAPGLSVWQQPSPSTQQLPIPHAVVILCLRGPFSCSIQRGNHGNGCLTLGVQLQSCYRRDLNSPLHPRQAHMTWATDLLLNCWRSRGLRVKAKAPVPLFTDQWPVLLVEVCSVISRASVTGLFDCVL